MTYAAYGIQFFATNNGLDQATASINQMINYLQFWINDFGGDMWSFWNVGYDRWRLAWAGYWSNFGVIILIFACFFYVMFILNSYVKNTNYHTNLLSAKIAFSLGVMLVVVYGCVVIITLSG